MEHTTQEAENLSLLPWPGCSAKTRLAAGGCAAWFPMDKAYGRHPPLDGALTMR